VTRKGPLAGFLVWGMTALVGDIVVGARVLSILLHTVLLLLVFRLASRLGGGRWTGLLAVVICGTFPGEYGWFRLPYHDAMIAVVLVLLLDQALVDLRRPASAVRLGLTAGVGLLAKAALPLYAAGPGLIWLLWRARRPRQLRLMALALGVAAAVCGWWIVFQRSTMLHYTVVSRQHSIPLLDKLLTYANQMPFALLLLAGALLGAAVAFRTRVAGGWPIALLLSAVLVPLSLLMWFDVWTRYLLPVLPLAGVLSALGIAGLARRLEPRLGRRAVAALLLLSSLLLLGRYVRDNLVGYPPPRLGREFGAGLVSPDRRLYTAYPRMVSTLWRRRLQVLQIPLLEGWIPVPWGVWRQRGYPLADLPQPLTPQLMRGWSHLHCLVFHREAGALDTLARARPHHFVDRGALRRINDSRRTVMLSHADPDGNRWSLVRVDLTAER
jgi:4-amino-4-deoxy-L-arabinose transferase-like glycosyltransferase